MIKIGYQGDVGSNSEEAARQFAVRNNIADAEYIPLISSAKVTAALADGNIQYGVCAVRNSTAGTVIETAEAVKGRMFTTADSLELPIHHCLFKKSGAQEEKLDTVVSHIQALNQTRKTRMEKFPHLKESEAADTALAAIDLAENVYPDNYAVICRKNAGIENGLELMAENIEDDPGNITEFSLFKIPHEDR